MSDKRALDDKQRRQSQRLNWLSLALLLLGLSTLVAALSTRHESLSEAEVDAAALRSVPRASLLTEPREHALHRGEVKAGDVQTVRPSLCLNGATKEEAQRAFKDARAVLVRTPRGGEPREAHEWLLLDEEHALLKRTDRLCVDLGVATLDALDVDSDHAIYLVGDDHTDEALSTRAASIQVITAAPLAWWEQSACLMLLASMLLRVLSWSAHPRPQKQTERWHPAHPGVGVVLFIASGIVVSYLDIAGRLEAAGATLTMGLKALIGGLSILAVHLALSFGFASRHDDGARSALALHASDKPPRVIAALGWGALLAFGANILLLVVGAPENTSAIQEITRMPGTRLALASMAALSPWYEELFFRGYLFGALERRQGAWIAGAISAGLFTLIHLPQHAGYLAPLIPIMLVAIATSALRASSGATTSSFALHLGYNALLVLPSLFIAG